MADPVPDALEQTAELAGFYLGHAVWCVADGETLCPLAGYEVARWPRGWIAQDGPVSAGRKLLRFEDERYEQAVARGRSWLGTNPQGAARAVFIFDGFVTVAQARTDALIVEAAAFEARLLRWQVVVPYRPRSAEAPFEVDAPLLLSDDSEELPRFEAAFRRGVHQHPQASPWKDRLGLFEKRRLRP